VREGEGERERGRLAEREREREGEREKGAHCIGRCVWAAMSALDRLERLEKLQSRPQGKGGTRKSRFAPRARTGKERGNPTREDTARVEPNGEPQGTPSRQEGKEKDGKQPQGNNGEEEDVSVKDKEERTVSKRNVGPRATLPSVGKRKRGTQKEGANPRTTPSSLTLREIIQRSNNVEKRKPGSEKPKSGGNQSQASVPTQERSTKKDKADAALAPQVAVVDGKIVVDEVSLRVEAAPARTTPLRRVEEAGTRLNAATYANRIAPEKWTAEDTSLFYRAIRQFGTDFSLIERLFPGRSRKQIKRKFKTEEALNPSKVEAALHPAGRNEADHYRAMIDMLQAAKEAKQREEDGEEDEPQETNTEG